MLVGSPLHPEEAGVKEDAGEDESKREKDAHLRVWAGAAAVRAQVAALRKGIVPELPENDGRAEDSFAEDTMVVACGLDREVPGLVVARQPLAMGSGSPASFLRPPRGAQQKQQHEVWGWGCFGSTSCQQHRPPQSSSATTGSIDTLLDLRAHHRVAPSERCKKARAHHFVPGIREVTGGHAVRD